MTITIGELIRRCDALPAESPPGEAGSAPFRGASIDSRTIQPGEVFFALPGERVDGHDFIPDAMDRGAALVIGSARQQSSAAHGAPTLWVDDVQGALTELARTWRALLRTTQVIAVTGSNGKTTACRLIHGALTSERTAVRSRRSFNNHLGVPLTLLSAAQDDAFVVCEIGANAPGEIATLAAIAQPDMAVITSIGRAHVGGFGSAEAVLKEKASLAHAVAPGGVVFVADDPPALAVEAETGDRHVVTVGFNDDASVSILTAEHQWRGATPQLCVTIGDGSRFESPVFGRHNARNVAFAIAVAQHGGISDAGIQQGLLAAELPPMRQEICMIEGVTFFNDAYNANPESMAASLETFLELTAHAQRRALVLGDMLELGDSSHEAHLALLRSVAQQSDSVRVILVGSAFAAAASVISDHSFEVHGAPSDALLSQLSSEWRQGDAVLVKGSRGLRLERVVQAFTKRGAVPA